MEPIRYDGEGESRIAVFTKQQIDILGEPDYYGFDKYLVIDSGPEYVCGATYWDQSYLKKKHRYSRLARFKSTVRNLFGESLPQIDEDEPVLVIMETYLKNNPGNPYEFCRQILKSYKLQKYYKHIPYFVKKYLGIKVFEMDAEITNNLSPILEEVYVRFTVFENLFYRIEKARKYFPNLKYTALRILKDVGVQNKFIPVLRTKRKIKELDIFFEALNRIRK